MKELSRYAEFIEQGLTAVDFPKEPTGLYDPLRYFLKIKGKRIRPILTLMGAQLFGCEIEKVLPQALAVEVFHNFTLVHDDIMDDAPLRRNHATVHEKWNRDVAILSGDMLLIKAYKLLGNLDPVLLPEAFDLLNDTSKELCEGQQFDLDFEQRNDVSVAEYQEMIRLKTSVLLGCALKMGAIVAGASEQDKEYIYHFGQEIGVAFQIQDDILDLYADTETFGKQVGGDVIANKKTLLHLTACTCATKEQLEILQQLQSEEDLELKVNRTRELFDTLKIREKCQEKMQFHYDSAKQALSKINVSEDRKVPLMKLAEYMMNRDV